MSEGEVSQLFYAYAHRKEKDAYWASRYLLTFASAEVCNEWWTLVQSEYPDQGVRNGPQLFAFQGDDFPSKPSKSKKFEHLATKWLYTQFGDANGTSGRHQDIIPVQGYDGSVISGGGGSAQKSDGGKSGETGQSSIDMSALLEALKSTQAAAEKNTEQIAQLAQNQEKSQERLHTLEKLVEGNVQQIKALTDAQTKSQEQSQQAAKQNQEQIQVLIDSSNVAQQYSKALTEENAKILRELQKQFAEQRKQQNAAPARANGQANGVNGQLGCGHNVHPPPRKLDKHLVGFAYGEDPPKRRRKGPGAKRPDTTQPAAPTTKEAKRLQPESPKNATPTTKEAKRPEPQKRNTAASDDFRL